MRNSRRIRIGVAAAIAAWSVVVWPSPTDAHDIPRSVAIIAYVKPEGHRLRMVVRVPLEAMRDVNWPLRGPGYLEIAKIDTLLRDAAKVWVANFVHVYEGDAALGDGRIAAARVSLPSDRSFERYETAVATATGPALSTTTDLAWQQAMLDIVLDFDIASDTSRFSINPELARLGVRTTTVLHFIVKGGVLLSGMYDLKPVRLSARSRYVHFDDGTEEALSPQRHLDRLHAPLVVAYASLDSPEFQRQSRDFAAAVKGSGKPIDLLVARGYNHFEAPETLGNPYGLLGRAALAQMGLG